MATHKQIAANRRNQPLSRRPFSSERKARVARKIISGSLADLAVHPDESRRDFEKIVDLFNRTFNPQNDLDHMLIGKMAVAHWRLLRLWRDEQTGAACNLALETRLDRRFFRHFDRYLLLHPQTRPEGFSGPVDSIN